MRRTGILVAALACFAMVAGSSTDGPSSGEFKALVKRVSKLEKQTDDMERTIARLEKALSGIPKDAAATNKGLERQIADLRRTVGGLEKTLSNIPKESAARCKELAKRIADLQKAFASHDKDAAVARKELTAVAARSDSQAKRLAEWFDKYHPREHQGRYHREEIARRN